MRRPWHVTKRRKTIRNWIFIGLALGVVILTGIAIDFSGVFDYHTSDKVLIENFRAHQHDFETLAAMAIEDDNVTSLYNDSVMLNDYKLWPAAGSDRFSGRRWDEYDALFKRLGTTAQHLLFKESGVVRVPASIITTEPDVNYEYRVSEKGYAFSRTPLSSLDDSLDEMGTGDLGIRYRRIDEHWYLYHDCGIGKPE